MSKIDAKTETQVVALIARGDSYSSIVEQLAKDGISLTPAAITGIKQRNTQALSYIQQRLADHEIGKTTRILDKTRNMIEKKLDDAGKCEDERLELRELYDNGEIDAREYLRRNDELVRRYHVTIKDLTTVSKEMFTQSQIEAGKPTSITETPEQAKKNLQTLLEAIQGGKEEDMVKAVFLDA